MINRKVILTCAVTGEGPFNPGHPAFPVTPAQIAASALDAAKAGAAILHLHVRDPGTGEGSRDPALFVEVVDRIREQNSEVILNLSAGMGGDFCPSEEDESRGGPGTDVAGPDERLRHVAQCRPEICTLDITTMNAEAANARLQRAHAAVYLNTTRTLRKMAQSVQALGVKPEIEVFGPGDLVFLDTLIAEGLVAEAPHVQFVMGVRWGMPFTPETIIYMRNMLPPGASWAALGLGPSQMQVVALAAILGGHCRVGLEDNQYLSRGVFATNAQLVELAVSIIESVGCDIARPKEARGLLNLGAAVNRTWIFD